MSDEHAEFPKMMSHPNAKKGQAIPIPGSQTYGPKGDLIRQDYQGVPDKFPPVLVHNEDDRDYYLAQGYMDNGKSDPSSFARAAANPADPDYKPAEYPKWVGTVLVNDEEEEAALAQCDDPAPEDPASEEGVTVADLQAQLATAQAELARRKAA